MLFRLVLNSLAARHTYWHHCAYLLPYPRARVNTTSSDPSWLDRAARHGALATDPPLSALGHRQARATAAFLRKITTTTTTRATTRDGDDGDGTGDGAGGCSSNGGGIDAILVSPYLRTIQTAAPTSDLLGVPLQIEDGLSESHATDRNLLASNDERFAYFPQIDPAYDPLLRIVPTLGHSCRRTGMPCESFAGDYVRRMGAFAHLLERAYRGRNVALFSHAASVALAAALLRRSMRGMTFAPCGVYRLVRVGDGPWTMAGSGHDNSGHATENCSTTYPWGFEEVHFDEVEKRDGRKGDYCGRSEGVDLDYFVVDDDDDDGRDNSEHKSKM